MVLLLTAAAPVQAVDVLNDYRTKASGNFNSFTTVWERFDGTAWVAAASFPQTGTTAGIATIGNTHTANVTGAIFVDGIVVAAGGILTKTANLTIANGADNGGLDLEVLSGGLCQNNGNTLTIASGATAIVRSGGTLEFTESASSTVMVQGGTLTIQSGGKLKTTKTGGHTIPNSSVTFDSGSYFEISGTTANNVTGWNANFGNVVFDVPAQNANRAFTAVPTAIKNDLIVKAFNNFTMADLIATSTLGIGGLYITNGTINLASGSVVPGTLQVTNNLVTGATGKLTVSSTGGKAKIVFTGGGAHTLHKDGEFINATRYDFTVAAANTVTLQGASNLVVNTPSTFTNSGTLALNNIIQGSGTFAAEAGSVTKLSGAVGIETGNGTANVQATTVAINPGASFEFNGASAQTSGTSFPGTVKNLVINNTAGVGLSATVTANGRVSGVGTVTSGLISVSGTGGVSPGNSPGTLSVEDLTLAAGSTNIFEVTNSATVGSGINDLLIVGGSFTANGASITVSNYGPTPIAAGTTIRLVDYSGGTFVSGFNSTPIWNSAVSNDVGTVATIVDDLAGHINLVVANPGTPPSGLYFSVQPSTTVAGVNISPAVVVTVTNLDGSPYTNATIVTVSKIAGNGTLSGIVSKTTDASGNATFTNLSIQLTGADKQLRATNTFAGIFRNSSVFTVTAAAAAKLAMGTQPSATASAGVAFAPQPVVEVVDAFGNVTISNAVVTASQSSGGTLQGTTNRTAVSGTATFTNLFTTNNATITLNFTCAGLTGTNSSAIAVAPGAADHLQITTPIATPQTNGQNFTPAPLVAILDAYGNLATNASANVVANLAATTGAGALAGTRTNATAAGVASFGALKFNLGNPGAAENIGVYFGAAGLPNVTNSDVTVNAAVAVQFVQQPTAAAAGAIVSPNVTVLVSNFATGTPLSGVTVTVAKSSGSGTLYGTLSQVTDGGGIATFTNLNFRVAGAKTLQATALTVSAGSSSFYISPGSLTKLQVLAPGETNAPDTVTGQAGAPDVQNVASVFNVTVNGVDTYFNVATNATDTIHITTSDTGDTEPGNAALVAGTRTFSITPVTFGAMTVTASDVSNGGVTADTSSTITVNSPYPLVRLPNTTLAMPAAPPAASYAFTNAFPGVVFTNPVGIVSAPDETNRLFIVEKRGRIAVITNLVAPNRSVFLDITSRVTGGLETSTSDERGLLSVAFHPGYATNGYFYVWYTGQDTTGAGSGMHDVLARYQVDTNNPNVALTNEQRFLSQRDEADNHNGGDLHFGPADGYLYLSMGDEGDQEGVKGNCQRIDRDFFAGMIRIEVDRQADGLEPNPHAAVVTNGSGQAFYKVPVDNPFVLTGLGGDWNGMFNNTNFTAQSNSVRTEFWAVGLRNPFRFSFSPLDGTLYLGDVGEQAWEELNVIERGKNYGWNWFEGPLQRSNTVPAGPVPTNFVNTLPLDAYTQTNQADKYSVIGGYVYTGSRLSQLYGAYIYGEYGKGNVWALRHTGTNVTYFEQLFTDDFESGIANLSTFGVDPSNLDMLYADLKNGTNGVIKRIVYSTNSPAGTPIPTNLAATGIFTNLTTLAVAPGIVPYDINVPFWSDNAIKSRWFSVPNTNLTIGFNAEGNWSFPTGAVWVKHFELELTNGVPASRKRLETRVLVKNSGGVYGATYRWGNSLTNADLVGESGLDETFVVNEGGGILRTQVWHYPSRSECLQCHTEMGGYVLGFNTPQLNKNFGYPAATTNQLQAYSDAGYFDVAVTNRGSLRALAAATNSAFSLEYRARSYLAANCRQCHQGAGLALWDARIETATAQAGLIDGDLINHLGDPANRVVKAGSLANSVLYHRIAVLDQDHMPPLASSVLDAQNAALVAAWITNGIPASLTLETPASLVMDDTVQAVLWANNASVTNDVTTDPETTFVSDNPAVITVSASGLLTALTDSGTANIIATFGVVAVTNTVVATDCAAPIVANDPDDASRTSGQAATLTVVATGVPLNYFWYKNGGTLLSDGATGNGSVISGAATASLTITTLSTNDSGDYHCVVSNQCGLDASFAATLTVNPPPSVSGLYPAGPQLKKNGLAVVLTNYAMAPYSSRTTGGYNPTNINLAGQLSRINFLRPEPTNTPGFGARYFVCDNNRSLYIVNKTNALATNAWASYINFEEVFPRFDNDPGFAGGLTTFAFDPAYATNGIFYTVHMETTGGGGPAPTNGALPGLNTNGYTVTTRIDPPSGSVGRVAVLVEWKDTNVVNATFEGTAREVLRMGFFSTIHPLGDLSFNPTALPGSVDYRNLYIAIGDGRAGETPGTTHDHPQRLDTIVGKILRITPDVSLRTNDAVVASGAYRIPSTGSDPNPFAVTNGWFTNTSASVRKEIYTYGFRNPHRFSWDAVSGNLIVNDIGFHAWEEVNIMHKGTNYGYAEREGIEQVFMSSGGQTGSQLGSAFPTNADSLTVTGIVTAVPPRYPAANYSHEDGDAISSGFVYRGSLLPQLQGKYVFGDITTARLFYCDYNELLSADDGDRLTVATIHELQPLFDSPFDSPDRGVVGRRMFDVVADMYTNRNGLATGQRITGSADNTAGNDPDGVPYGKGRADIRFALGDDNELYLISKSDGMVRKFTAADWLPVANTNVYSRGAGASLKIAIAELLATCSDADTDTLSLVALGTSTNGVTLQTNSSHIFYLNSNNVADRFNYVISDGKPGGVSTGLVIVTISQSASTSSAISLEVGVPGPNSNTILFAGIPSNFYVVQFATNLSTNVWFTLGTNMAGSNGVWTVIDTTATNAQRYYRTLVP